MLPETGDCVYVFPLPVTSCDDVANGVITRNGYSGSDFTVTCADGQTGSYQCHQGHWSPPRPVCNPVITNPGM